MRTLLLAAFTGIFALSAGAQNIATVRTQAVNSTVIVKGVVINGAEMGTIRYVQDNSGGISVYDTGLSSVNRGDSIMVKGPMTDYKALLEISTTTANATPVTFTALGTGSTQTPSVITAAQFGENVEGRLIKFMGCTFGATGTFSTGINYTVTTTAGQFVARVTSTVSNLMGTPIPTTPVDIVGIGSQFCSSGGSCATGYQLALRDKFDITASMAGVHELSREAVELTVYPNPATNKLSFKLSPNEVVHSIVVTDVTGKVVLSSKENTTSIDVYGMNNGVYFLNVATQTATYRSKFNVSK